MAKAENVEKYLHHTKFQFVNIHVYDSIWFLGCIKWSYKQVRNKSDSFILYVVLLAITRKRTVPRILLYPYPHLWLVLKFKWLIVVVSYVCHMLRTCLVVKSKLFKWMVVGNILALTSKHFYLHKVFIFHHISCPHIPEQNGLAEWKHQHIVETGLSLMAHSSIPQKFWVDAFANAVFLNNQLPTHTLGNMYPYEKLFQKHPTKIF